MKDEQLGHGRLLELSGKSQWMKEECLLCLVARKDARKNFYFRVYSDVWLLGPSLWLNRQSSQIFVFIYFKPYPLVVLQRGSSKTCTKDVTWRVASVPASPCTSTVVPNKNIIHFTDRRLLSLPFSTFPIIWMSGTGYPLSENLVQATHYLNTWNRLPTIWTPGTGYPLSDHQPIHYLSCLEQASF